MTLIYITIINNSDYMLCYVMFYSCFSDGSRPLLGDFLVIVGTVFFAMSNVGEVCK